MNSPKRMRRRQHKRGEMLVETVIALAVFSLAVLAAATLVSASTNILRAAGEQLQAVEQASQSIETKAQPQTITSGVLRVTLNGGIAQQVPIEIQDHGVLDAFGIQP